MARKSTVALTVVPATAPGALPPVPDDLVSPAEREFWQSVVESKPADWFGADSLPVLKEYVRACVSCDMLAGRLSAALDGDDAATVKLMFDLRDKESRRAVSLATKLRLTQQSRYGARSADRADGRAAGRRPWQK